MHEGMPGHYFQKVMSWTNEDPIRRHYYDSSANEGIGFYAEEMMLQAGLFDDSPRTREIIYNFMRFRALRVEVEVKLSTGDFTIEQAADYFVKTVPLDRATAMEDATFYASVPGVGISYQTGKLQIMKFLAEARQAQGDKFNLREFHDFVWKNGNVPIALLRYEYLGKTDEIEALHINPCDQSRWQPVPSRTSRGLRAAGLWRGPPARGQFPGGVYAAPRWRGTPWVRDPAGWRNGHSGRAGWRSHCVGPQRFSDTSAVYIPTRIR